MFFCFNFKIVTNIKFKNRNFIMLCNMAEGLDCINPELFVIPKQDGNYILYVPLEGNVLEVTSGTVGLLKAIKSGKNLEGKEDIINQLKDKKILVSQEYIDKFDPMMQKRPKESCEKGYKPTAVTLFPTSDCNLRCLYCYASAGDVPHEMPIDIAKTGIDYIVNNAIEIKSNKVSVGFHGGGEPFSNFNLMKHAVQYAKQIVKDKDLKVDFSVGTNGILSKKQLEWLVETGMRANISLDGTKDIQNYQRPTRTGGESFDGVVSTIKYFEENKHNYGIRATITEYNVERMKEIYEFFKSISSLKSFHLEPVFECGRCKMTKIHAPAKNVFLHRLLEVKEHAAKDGVEIYYSGGRFGNITDHFCGAAGSNFFITQDGYLTSCLEVAHETDERSKIFFFGQARDGKVEINEERLKYLKSRTIVNMPPCKDCFAKFTCSGDCLAKVLASSGDMFDSSNNERCEINQQVLIHQMEEALKNDKKI